MGSRRQETFFGKLGTRLRKDVIIITTTLLNGKVRMMKILCGVTLTLTLTLTLMAVVA
jgi:hypothetical protein